MQSVGSRLRNYSWSIEASPMNDVASPRNRIASSLLFAVVSVCVTRAANFEAAQSLPQRTENKVFRERVKPNWLPDGHSFWYRVQTGPGRYEFVLIDCKTGKRRSASSPADLGLPALAAVKTSSLPVRIRKTSKTGEPSALTFVNRLDEDVDLYWIDREGRHIRYGGIRAGAEREQSTYEGHIWLITSRSGEHLAVIEGASQPQTVLIDGEGTSTAKATTPDSATTDSEPGFRSPDGRCTAVVPCVLVSCHCVPSLISAEAEHPLRFFTSPI